MINNMKKWFIFILITVLLFQDSIHKLIGVNFINYIDETFILALFVYAIIKSKFKIPSLAVKLGVMTGIFLLIGTACCIIFSDWNLKNLIVSGLLSIKFFVLVVSVIIINPSKDMMECVFGIIKILGIVCAISGIINLILPNVWIKIIPYAWVEWRLGIPSVLGLFIHPGQFGWFMLFVAILHYSDYRILGNKRSLVYSVIFIILAITSIKVKVIVGVVGIALIDMFIIDRKNITKKKIIITVAGIGVTAIAFGKYIFDNVSKYVFGASTDVSARYVLLNRSFRILADYFPFGVGFGKYGSWYARIDYSEYYYKYNCESVYGLTPQNPKFATDTFWPSIIGETGIIGTILYVFIIITLVINLFKNLKNTQLGVYARKVAYFGFFVLIQSLIETMAEPAFNSAPQNVFVGVIVGVGLCIGLKKDNEKQNHILEEG